MTAIASKKACADFYNDAINCIPRKKSIFSIPRKKSRARRPHNLIPINLLKTFLLFLEYWQNQKTFIGAPLLIVGATSN